MPRLSDRQRLIAAIAVLLLLAAAAAGAWAMLGHGPRLTFVERTVAPGFVTVSGNGSASRPGAVAVLLGQVAGRVSAAEPAPASAPASICEALWGGPTHAAGPAPTRIAVFSDANCPFCRVLDGMIEDLAEDRPDLVIRHHEWAILGPASVLSARAALAAGEQGAYDPMRRRLLQSRFLATPAYLDAVAEEMGLDPARLGRDMQSPRTDAALAATASAAQGLGLRGTPALVIGGAVHEGVITASMLRALIEQAPPGPCA